VPVTINAVVGGEDIIDAMDLRCFGIGKRADWVLIAFSIALFLGSTAASISGFGRLWVPQWILNLATMR
jgi:energy-coupling factor transport system permease protein